MLECETVVDPTTLQTTLIKCFTRRITNFRRHSVTNVEEAIRSVDQTRVLENLL